MDEDDLGSSQQTLADGQGSDLVVGDDSTRIADDGRFAFLDSQHPIDVDAGVHAGEYGDVFAGWEGERYGELLGVGGVVLQVFVGDSHRSSRFPRSEVGKASSPGDPNT